MGQVDYHVHSSSMSSNNTLESKLLYVNNKTSEWFNNKSEEENKKITVQTMKKTEQV